MEHARPPAELSLDGGPASRADAWRKWLKQFKVFLKASGVYKEPKDVQASLLINLIGPDGYDVYCTLKFEDEKDHDDIQKLIEKFNSHFGTKPNTTMVRFKFFTRNQEIGESIDEYVTALKLLSQQCEFENLEDGLLRDRIVCGVRDSSVRDRLLRTDQLTLDKAVMICQSNEISSEEGREIEGVKTEKSRGVSVDTVWRPRGAWRGSRGGGARWRGRGSAGRAGGAEVAARGARAGPGGGPAEQQARVHPCAACSSYYCDGGVRCPARNVVCYSCGDRGHYRKMCQLRKSNNVFIVHENPEEDDLFYISSVDALNEMRPEDAKCTNNLENEKSPPSYQSVADFYAGKSVLVTGGTGFVGKLLIERLLYTCKDIDNIYMLIREKQGININDRINEISDNKLKAEQPQALKKIIPVAGAVSLPGLGITTEDEETLIDKVSVVFHSAATISFKELLPVIMNINFEGTKRIHNLCKRMKQLEVLVHMSTAYAHPTRKTLEDRIYPPPEKIEDVYKFIEKCGNDMEATMKLIDPHPSTYTFVKALTESYIAEHQRDVPTVIIRPSAITATESEPTKGWIDNGFGPTRNIYHVANGWVRIYLGEKGCVLDAIPVDYVCNMSIVAAARSNRPTEVEVYNSCSSSENPITWHDIFRYMIKTNVKRKRNQTPFPFIIRTNSRMMKNIVTFILITTPAHIADMFLRIMDKEAKYVKIQSTTAKIRDSLEYYTTIKCVMKSDKVDDLTATLSNSDKRRYVGKSTCRTTATGYINI